MRNFRVQSTATFSESQDSDDLVKNDFPQPSSSVEKPKTKKPSILEALLSKPTSEVSKQPSNTIYPVTATKYLCAVCGDFSSGQHYGAYRFVSTYDIRYWQLILYF